MFRVRGEELIARDRFALMLYTTAIVVLMFMAYSLWVNPRGRRKRELEEM